jgi:hypothetical protein
LFVNKAKEGGYVRIVYSCLSSIIILVIIICLAVFKNNPENWQHHAHKTQDENEKKTKQKNTEN